MTEKLKPCPFCGGKAIYSITKYGLSMQVYKVAIRCCECGAHISVIDEKATDPRAKVILAWNKRANCGAKMEQEVTHEPEV